MLIFTLQKLVMRGYFLYTTMAAAHVHRLVQHHRQVRYPAAQITAFMRRTSRYTPWWELKLWTAMIIYVSVGSAEFKNYSFTFAIWFMRILIK